MSDFSIQEMLAMQQALQEKYKDKWERICPEAGKHKLLWMFMLLNQHGLIFQPNVKMNFMRLMLSDHLMGCGSMKIK